MIEALIGLMQTPDDVPGPINIGNPEEFSVLELASKVVDMTGSRSRIVYCPPAEDDPRQRQPDIAKARHVLSWWPRVPLAEGLARTIAYFDRLLSEDNTRSIVTEGLSA